MPYCRSRPRRRRCAGRARGRAGAGVSGLTFPASLYWMNVWREKGRKERKGGRTWHLAARLYNNTLAFRIRDPSSSSPLSSPSPRAKETLMLGFRANPSANFTSLNSYPSHVIQTLGKSRGWDGRRGGTYDLSDDLSAHQFLQT